MSLGEVYFTIKGKDDSGAALQGLTARLGQIQNIMAAGPIKEGFSNLADKLGVIEKSGAMKVVDGFISGLASGNTALAALNVAFGFFNGLTEQAKQKSEALKRAKELENDVLKGNADALRAVTEAQQSYNRAFVSETKIARLDAQGQAIEAQIKQYEQARDKFQKVLDDPNAHAAEKSEANKGLAKTNELLREANDNAVALGSRLKGLTLEDIGKSLATRGLTGVDKTLKDLQVEYDKLWEKARESGANLVPGFRELMDNAYARDVKQIKKDDETATKEKQLALDKEQLATQDEIAKRVEDINKIIKSADQGKQVQVLDEQMKTLAKHREALLNPVSDQTKATERALGVARERGDTDRVAELEDRLRDSKARDERTAQAQRALTADAIEKLDREIQLVERERQLRQDITGITKTYADQIAAIEESMKVDDDNPLKNLTDTQYSNFLDVIEMLKKEQAATVERVKAAEQARQGAVERADAAAAKLDAEKALLESMQNEPAHANPVIGTLDALTQQIQQAGLAQADPTKRMIEAQQKAVKIAEEQKAVQDKILANLDAQRGNSTYVSINGGQ